VTVTPPGRTLEQDGKIGTINEQPADIHIFAQWTAAPIKTGPIITGQNPVESDKATSFGVASIRGGLSATSHRRDGDWSPAPKPSRLN
jgi:hypothetical protein